MTRNTEVTARHDGEGTATTHPLVVQVNLEVQAELERQRKAEAKNRKAQR